jgi:hypothetical protein
MPALVFRFWMWGIPGVILSVPMLAIAKIICDVERHTFWSTFLLLYAEVMPTTRDLDSRKQSAPVHVSDAFDGAV